MYKPDFKQFEELCGKGSIVPVFKEYIADLETPVSVLSRFCEDENVFLLESVEGGERWGRYSFIGINPHEVFYVENGKAYLKKNGKTTELEGNGLFALRDVMKDYKSVPVPGLPPFFGGAVGYMSYETVNEFEKLPEPKTPVKGPMSCFMMTDEMVIFDNVRHTVIVSVCVRHGQFASLKEAYDYGTQRIEEISKTIKAPAPLLSGDAVKCEAPPKLQPNMTKDEFKQMVVRAKEYIVEGDIIQMVPSQRFETKLTMKPIQLYRALRLVNPSPYTFYLKFGEKMLIGSSPEVMAKLDNGKAEVRPIAGTRKRGKNEQEDAALSSELLSDEKERAEHIMLVDLARNDLGRCAVPASVQVRDFMTVERYSHVMHIVSNVECMLSPGLDAFDVVKASFPAGTLSGAPKIRAMEIINELEPQSRGAYGGSVGYFGYNDSMDMAITIRTLIIDGDTISVQAGAGIVYDSDPESEYQETINKAAAVFKAIELAANGLELA